LDEDYRRAGYRLLPSVDGRSKKSALFTILYTLILIPLGISPWVMGLTGPVSAVISTLLGVLFILQGIKLYRTCEIKQAKRLMFYSILYNPVIFLSFLLDKI